MNALYANSGTTNISATGVSISGTGVSGGSYTDSIQRIVVYGNAHTYGLYTGIQPSLVTVTVNTNVTANYVAYFTFTTNGIGINGVGSNVSFIRIA